MASFDTFVKVSIPGLSKIPILGPILFTQDYMVYALYILVPLATLFIAKTRPGLKLRALGEDPAVLDAAGLNVYGMRYLYVILGSAIVACGGAYVTLAYTPSWVDGITAGKGWIASALVIFSGWNPTRAALGALLFGGVEVIGLRLQSAGVAVPSYFLSMLPYVCTIIVLILSTGNFIKKRTQPPASLGKSYDREAR
jgi:simple sugar transport system permease protein